MALSTISSRYLTLTEVFAAGWIVFKSQLKAVLLIAFIFFYIPGEVLRPVMVPEPTSRLIDIALNLGLWVFHLVAIMSVAVITERAVLGASTGFAQALRAALARWGQAVLASLLLFLILYALFVVFSLLATAIAAVTGLIALDAPTGLALFLPLIVVPIMIVTVYYAFTFEAVVLRQKGGMAALAYSKALVQGHWWRVLVLFLVFLSSNWLPPYLMGHALGPFLGESAAVGLLVGALTSMMNAFAWVAGTILFLNLDYRKDAAVEDKPTPQAAG